MTDFDAPIVDVSGLGKTYYPASKWMRILVRTPIREPIVALDDVTLQLRRGEILAVVGPNGAGKTTLFRLLMGLTTPTAGSGSIFGHDIGKPEPKARRLIGYTSSDDRTLFLRQTVEDNLRFHGRLHGMDDEVIEDRTTVVLEQVGLEGTRTRSGFALSAGMRARLQIARGLLHSPRLLVLDEPTGAVDPIAAFGLIELIRDIAREEDVAVMISSHRLDEIESLSENILLLDKGKVRFHGNLDHLRSIYDGNTARVSFSSPAAAQAAFSSVAAENDAEVQLSDDVIQVSPRESVGAVIVAMGGLAEGIAKVEEPKTSLMELLARMYGTEPSEPGEVVS
jgi:ABC-2 type transport system ATP-binding protein